MGLEEIDDGREIVGGTFLCHRCEETVDEARHDPEKETLTWTCSNGHVSKMKDFV